MDGVSTDRVRVLWERGRAVAIGVGVALDADGVWWTHEWCWGGDSRLIETLREFKKYYGARLQGDEIADYYGDRGEVTK